MSGAHCFSQNVLDNVLATCKVSVSRSEPQRLVSNYSSERLSLVSDIYVSGVILVKKVSCTSLLESRFLPFCIM